MIWGENLSADDIAVECPCGIAATIEVIDDLGISRGWFCREHAQRTQEDLKKQAKIATAIVRKVR